MSGRPSQQSLKTDEFGADSVLLKPRFKRKEFTSRMEANVLVWCLRSLLYCQSNNSLHKLSRGRGSGFEDLKSACAVLDVPKNVTDLEDLARYAPEFIRKTQQMDLTSSATERSIDALCEHCSITQAERKLLLFGVAINENELMESVFDHCFRRVNTARLYKVLAFVLNESLEDTQNALRANGFLAKAGMLRVNPMTVMGFDGRLDLGYGLVEALEVANGNWNEIIDQVCSKSRRSCLEERDFNHIASEWSLVLGYIRGAVSSNRSGANVLLCGPPGTGKTEFARAVIEASGVQGFEVISEQPDGESIPAEGRRSLYCQANLYLQHDSASVLLIDEMDGMLEINPFPHGPRNRGSSWTKASANAMLENNKVPSIWITNSPNRLDPAQLRRFDLIVQFSALSRAALKNQVESKLGGFGLSGAWKEAASAAPGMTPGLVETMSVVAESIKQGKVKNANMEALLNTAMRQRGIKVSRKKSRDYRIEYCNASMHSDALTATLLNKHDARCLLHGTTGTGKTAFARHMAETLELEPQLVRPSDILDMYVGGTERNIARLFENADPEETLIILDEFESFASDRKSAERNWMVSQVNELLTQLEAYEGRVIACTNLVNYIDPAIRRRFQLKVELLPLNESQRISLFKDSCRKLGLHMESDMHFASRVFRLEQLAYGHIANAVEIAENIPDVTIESFAGLLEQEIESTNGRVARPIGFLQ